MARRSKFYVICAIALICGAIAQVFAQGRIFDGFLSYSTPRFSPSESSIGDDVYRGWPWAYGIDHDNKGRIGEEVANYRRLRYDADWWCALGAGTLLNVMIVSTIIVLTGQTKKSRRRRPMPLASRRMNRH